MTRKHFQKHHPDQVSAAGNPLWIFLTPTQAVDAVALDFQAYGPQPDLFRRIAPLILGKQCRITARNENWSGVSVLRGTTFDPVEDHHLGFYLIHVLETDPPDLNTLADICRQVFQASSIAGHNHTGTISGIWVDPDTGETTRTCPWLAPCPDHADRFVCTIHPIKPEVCRQYPFTAKHAAMTGCCGRFAAPTEPPVSRNP